MARHTTTLNVDNDTLIEVDLARTYDLTYTEINDRELTTIVADLVDDIRDGSMKVVSMVGGAASGKSTLAKKVVHHLQQRGINANILCTDNYAVGDREFRNTYLRHADASYRYNTELMRAHIAAIKSITGNDEWVRVPIIDAATGIAADLSEDMYQERIGKTELLIIEGDFPQGNFDTRFYLHMPDRQRLVRNIERELESSGKDEVDIDHLSETFSNRQKIIHETYTIPSARTAKYVMVANEKGDERSYDMYEKRSHR